MGKKILLHKRESHHWFVVGTVCIGAFMAALDASIINVALPTVSKDFAVGMDTVEWVSIAYLLTLTSLLTLLGSLSDRLGRKLFYSIGFIIFGMGSAFCGLAVTMPFLIIARVLQALGAAMLQANSIAIITSSVPATSRGKAIGIQGSAQAIGLSIGPTIGGLLIAHFGWRLIFYVNIPVAILGTLLASIILPKDQPKQSTAHFDYLGAALFTPSLILLVLIFKDSYKVGLTSPEIIMEIIAVIVLLSVFVRREKKCPNPMINLNLLKIKSFTFGNISGLLSYSLMFGVLFLMPFYLDWILKLSSVGIGLILTVVSVAMFIMSPISGALADKVEARTLTTTGMAMASLGSIMLITLSGSSAIYIDLVGLALVGLGMGLFTAPNNSSVMGSVPREHVGVVGGILNMSRSLGMSMGVAIAGMLYNVSYNSFAIKTPTATEARILSFHIGFGGMAVIGIAATIICLLNYNRSKANKLCAIGYVSSH